MRVEHKSNQPLYTHARTAIERGCGLCVMSEEVGVAELEQPRAPCRTSAHAAAIVERFYTLVHSRTSLKRIRDVFADVDADGDGKVCADELFDACGALGIAITRVEVREVWPLLL